MLESSVKSENIHPLKIISLANNAFKLSKLMKRRKTLFTTYNMPRVKLVLNVRGLFIFDFFKRRLLYIFLIFKRQTTVIK